MRVIVTIPEVVEDIFYDMSSTAVSMYIEGLLLDLKSARPDIQTEPIVDIDKLAAELLQRLQPIMVQPTAPTSEHLLPIPEPEFQLPILRERAQQTVTEIDEEDEGDAILSLFCK